MILSKTAEKTHCCPFCRLHKSFKGTQSWINWNSPVVVYSISIYLLHHPSRRLRAGARECGVSGGNAFKNKKFP